MSLHLSNEINNLKQDLIKLSTMVEENLHKAIEAFRDLDVEKSFKVIEIDREIDSFEVNIEEECLKILALHRPLAADLRFIVTVIRINNDLERIGDLAASLAAKVIKLSKKNDEPNHVIDFTLMFEKATTMLKQSLDSLVNMDSKLAEKVMRMDDEVDQLKSDLRHQIKSLLKETPERTSVFMHNLSIIYYLERIGDLSTNIAEDVIYLVEGIIVRHGRQMFV